jgi:uncharacterized protein YbjT (DUF2867 family)
MEEKNLKTAIVVGSTGLVGSSLVKKLLADPRYAVVKTFVRKPSGISHYKLEENVVDFNMIDLWEDKIKGDELFSALGTTIKQAGTKENQYKVDYTYQYEIAKAAAENEVEKYLLVSSVGANRFSASFYLRIKGALEFSVSQMPFKRIVIFQPSLLVGERKEKRFGENLSAPIISLLTKLIPTAKKYRPIDAEIVADAMINSANDSLHNQVITYKLNQIFDIAR